MIDNDEFLLIQNHLATCPAQLLVVFWWRLYVSSFGHEHLLYKGEINGILQQYFRKNCRYAATV